MNSKSLEENLVMSISENIKKAREKKGLTQEKAAVLCNLSKDMLVKYELGITKNPGADAIVKIANGLGISTDELLLDKEKRHVNEELRAIFNEIERLDESEKQSIKLAMKGMLSAILQERL